MFNRILNFDVSNRFVAHVGSEDVTFVVDMSRSKEMLAIMERVNLANEIE